MSDEPGQIDIERETSRLNEGLKSCRSVMNNYRSMISGGDPISDEGDSGGYAAAASGTSASYDSEPSVN